MYTPRVLSPVENVSHAHDPHPPHRSRRSARGRVFGWRRREPVCCPVVRGSVIGRPVRLGVRVRVRGAQHVPVGGCVCQGLPGDQDRGQADDRDRQPRVPAVLPAARGRQHRAVGQGPGRSDDRQGLRERDRLRRGRQARVHARRGHLDRRPVRQLVQAGPKEFDYYINQVANKPERAQTATSPRATTTAIRRSSSLRPRSSSARRRSPSSRTRSWVRRSARPASMRSRTSSSPRTRRPSTTPTTPPSRRSRRSRSTASSSTSRPRST